MFEQGLYTLLATDPGLSAVIAGRVFAADLPKNTALPAMTYLEAGGSRRSTFDTSGMQKIRIQFDLFAAGKSDVASLGEALRLLLDGYQGTLADGTVIQNAELIPGRGRYDPDSRYFHTMVEYYFLFNLNGPAMTGIALTPSSATPVFDGAGGAVFPYTLAQNVIGSTTRNLVPGQIYVFEIIQAAGGTQYSFTWPATMAGASPVSLNAGQKTMQTAVCLVGGSLLCLGPAVYI
jgi:hypothetical protein